MANSSRTSAAFVGAPRRRTGRARIADRERVQQVEPLGVTDGAAEPGDRALVGQVAARRGVGEQQVVAHEPRQQLGAVLVEADAAPRPSRADLDPDHRVVAVLALADVVEQRREQQHVGARATGDVAVEPVACRSAGSSIAAHSATASSECRSTVKRW